MNLALSFVIPTRIFCHAALDTVACAPFSHGKRMKSPNATHLNRKSGGAKSRNLQFRGPLLENGNANRILISSNETLRRIEVEMTSFSTKETIPWLAYSSPLLA